MFDPTSNLDVLFDTCGQPATINGEAVTIVLDDTFVLVDQGDGSAIPSRAIQASAKTADLDALATPVAHGSPVVVAGVNFTVFNPQPDGAGLTIIQLEKA